jgi:hypothetical protein
MHDALIFSGLEFRQMGVYCRRFPRMRVHMEKRRIENRQKERRYCSAGRDSSHGSILMLSGVEVKPQMSEEFLNFLSVFVKSRAKA